MSKECAQPNSESYTAGACWVQIEFPIVNYSSGIMGCNTMTAGNSSFLLTFDGNLGQIKSIKSATVRFTEGGTISKAQIDGREVPARKLESRDGSGFRILATAANPHTRV